MSNRDDDDDDEFDSMDRVGDEMEFNITIKVRGVPDEEWNTVEGSSYSVNFPPYFNNNIDIHGSIDIYFTIESLNRFGSVTLPQRGLRSDTREIADGELYMYTPRDNTRTKKVFSHNTALQNAVTHQDLHDFNDYIRCCGPVDIGIYMEKDNNDLIKFTLAFTYHGKVTGTLLKFGRISLTLRGRA